MPNFTPVDYDPFAGAAEAAPNLFPADGPLSASPGAPNPVPYNPFAGASAPRLIPVDHDPFADNPAGAPRLIPVDYDPFGAAAAPNLIPVDHDPFADNPSAAPKLIPVDYDPFADTTSLLDGQQAGWNPQPAPDTSLPNSPDLTQLQSPQSAAPNFSSLLDFNSQPATQSHPTGLLIPTGFRLPIPLGPFPIPPPGAPPQSGQPQTFPGFEEWYKNAEEMAKGFFNFFRRRAGSAGGGGNNNDYCHDRREAEVNRCIQQFLPLKNKRPFNACVTRADDRRSLCIGNGGKPHPDEPPEYNWNDIPLDSGNR